MTRTRHKIPTGLTIEDRFISVGSLSLSVPELAVTLVGAAVGYGGVWKGLPGLPAPVRTVAAILPPLAALAAALARPGGRPLTHWLFVTARYQGRPRVAVWRPRAPRPAEWRTTGAGWAGLAPRPLWDIAPGDDRRAGEAVDVQEVPR